MLVRRRLLAFAACAATVAAAPAAGYAAPGVLGTAPQTLTTGQIDAFSVARSPYAVLEASPDPAAARIVRAAGGRRLGPGIWRLRSAEVPLAAQALRENGLLQGVQQDTRLALRYADTTPPAPPTDPYFQMQGWVFSAINDDPTQAPGPSVAVSIIDSGVDTTHPEFTSRPNTVMLNPQNVSSSNVEEIHGTAVASVAAASANGVGIVGAYPQAEIRSWDMGDGSCSQIVDGFNALLARGGRQVINMSWVFYNLNECPALLTEVERAAGSNTLLVAAVGNDRAKGSPVSFPAALPHVLAVAATDNTGAVTSFSSVAPEVDIAAPGQDVPTAVPTWFDQSGYRLLSGTSFASPIVAGAAASIWARRPDLNAFQVADLIRRTARDIGTPGWDKDTGYGMMDVAAALTAPAPAVDPGEPNDDIPEVKPGGVLGHAAAPLVGYASSHGLIRATVEYVKDPSDTYRVWQPARKKLYVRLTPQHGRSIALEVFSSRATTVSYTSRLQAFRSGQLLAGAYKLGGVVQTALIPAQRGGRWLYVCVFIPGEEPAGPVSYTLAAVATR